MIKRITKIAIRQKQDLEEISSSMAFMSWIMLSGFGEPEKVFAKRGILSTLEIDTEDHAEMIVQFKSGAVCTIHMDYLQHGYSRRCKVVCEEGTIMWDFVRGDIGRITTSNPQWVWKDMKFDIYYNQMYMDEIRYFIDCVSSGRRRSIQSGNLFQF